MIDLGYIDSGGDDTTFGCANAINSFGQIIGEGGHWRKPPFSSLPHFDQRYSFGTFPVLVGYHSTTPTALNDRGQVIGDLQYIASGASLIIHDHGFLWRRGTMQDLGAMPAFPRSQGFAVNNKGQVAGTVLYVSKRNPDTGSVSVNSHAFFYDGKMHDVNSLLPKNFSEAAAINERGEVTGYVSVMITGKSYSDRRAFRYANRKLTLIPMPASWHYSVGNAINRAGEIVGYYEKSGVRHAFWSHGGRIDDLNGLVAQGSGWILGEATGINDQGQIIGRGDYHGTQRGFLYQKDRVVDLGALPGLPSIVGRGINNRGEVVGVAYPDGVKTDILAPSRAFMYREGKMFDLNNLIKPDSDWFLYEARGINDRGQIVGYGSHIGKGSPSDHGGAFLLTPSGEPHTSIP